MNSSPFVPSAHGHPNFNPIKMTKSVTPSDASKNSKQPKPPDKPLMPYMRYSKKVWDDVKARYPDLKIWEISRIVGQMWRDLPEEDKQSYIDAFEIEKSEYNESLRTYHNSPAYQTWISSLKSKALKEHEERDTHKRKDKKGNNHGFNSPQKTDGRVSLQSLDSELDDDDDYFSMKHLAAARFYRNHKLITEIFSDVVVPDPRSVVTNNRLQILQRQVESLKMHQKKLDEELQNLEDKFQEKKRTILDSGEIFTNEMCKRFKSKPVSEAVTE
ncbi:high mobility group [Blomia tropicalis]|nr:high mobility group [Blomia tropicalis]